MNEKRQDSQLGGMSIGDVYFILFRQKWMILTFFMAGILGAVVLLFVVKPPQYQSEAIFFIRYVMEGKSLSPPGDESNTRPLDQQRDSIINTEIATLHSLDLAKEVAQAVTPEKILAKVGGRSDINRAAFMVRNGLTVEPISESSAIRITYQNSDPALVQPILSEFIDAYLTKHVQLHQGLGVPNKFLTNETARLRAELVQTDDELRKIKNAAGVISVEETQKAYAQQISSIRQALFDAEAQLSGSQAILEQLTKSSGVKPEATNDDLATDLPSEQVDKYKRVCALLTFLKEKEQNYQTQQGFTAENVLVKQIREQIGQNEALKKSLEEKYPKLSVLDVFPLSPIVGQQGEVSIDLITEAEQVTALKAKIRVLNLQMNQVWTEATNFDKVRTTISGLEQKQEVEEANLKYYMSNLEETRIDEALGADRAANISIIQAPSPPVKGWSKPFKKKVAMVAAGGVFGGLALAFLIELLLDRSIKRPTDIETKLRLPLLISIPDITKNGHRPLASNTSPLRLKDAESSERKAAGRAAPHPEAGVDAGNRRHPLRRFYEGLRDRLIVYFEVNNLTHKPKLVGVTSCAKGAGVSSIATGLAVSLSETGEGNVLLVDMNIEGGEAQHFHKGKPNCGLGPALETETKENALVKENLYVATEPMRSEELPQVLPKRFASLISKIRHSDYDYIIFDMPPVSETTITFRSARLMDMLLIVIEAEKTNQEVVKRVISLLAESKVNVSTVLNKTQTYVPRRLHQEFLHDV
jgi:uncharacterized protein involved in exopolysaccharide biosynthesis/Mrp family chromosome partitioning ATPase